MIKLGWQLCCEEVKNCGNMRNDQSDNADDCGNQAEALSAL